MTTMAATRKTGSTDTRQLGMHQGRVLVDQLADKYHTLLLAVVEMAQNAIDANATTIFVGINQRNSSVVVLDDGDGIDDQKFEDALTSVGQSVKAKGSLGRFGLGMIAPLNKCREFQIISQPRSTPHVRLWTFVGAKIREQKNSPEIPTKLLPKMPNIPAPFNRLAGRFDVTWRTYIKLTGVTKDRTISVVDIDELAQHVQTKLGRGMQRNDTHVHVAILNDQDKLSEMQVDPLKYTGQPLPVVAFEEDPCGRVEFHLFRAPLTENQRKGQVQVLRLSDNRPISWSEFAFQALGSRWLKEEPIKAAFEAVGSGYFEGSVQGEHLELDSEGSKFVMNDALRAMYIAIYRWYSEHGKQYFENAREQREDERYRDLGQKSLLRLYTFLDSHPAFISVTPELEGVASRGPLGAKELDPEAEDPPEEEPGQKGETPRKKKRRVVAKHPDEDEPDETSEEPARKPSYRGKGTQRGHHTRLNFAYDRVPGKPELYWLDRTTGTIVFNISHPLWESCDETSGKRTTRHDRQVMTLQEYVAMRLIELLKLYPDEEDFEAHRWELDEHLTRYVPLFILR